MMILLLGLLPLLSGSPVSVQAIPVRWMVDPVPSGMFHNCGIRGDAKRRDASDLDVLKNRANAPTVLRDVTYATFAAAATVDAFSPDQAVRIRVKIANVIVGGIESANCHATASQWRDSHIEVVGPDDPLDGQPVVFEVTPRWRAAMLKAGIADWSTAALKLLIGKVVEIEGWPLWDAEHANAAETTHPGSAKNWRQTPLEIHPVTAIRVLP